MTDHHQHLPDSIASITLSDAEQLELTAWAKDKHRLKLSDLDELMEWAGMVVKRKKSVFKGKARQINKYHAALKALGFNNEGVKIHTADNGIAVKKEGEFKELEVAEMEGTGRDVYLGTDLVHIGFSNVRGA